MRTLFVALALTLSVSSAFALTAPEIVPAHPDFSAGYEAAYADLCGITPEVRATWASPAPDGPISDVTEYGAGFIAAIDDAYGYEEQGFDLYEYCGDFHP